MSRVVIKVQEMTERKVATDNATGEILTIGCLLACETVSAEPGVADFCDTVRRDSTSRSFESRVGRTGGCK